MRPSYCGPVALSKYLGSCASVRRSSNSAHQAPVGGRAPLSEPQLAPATGWIVFGNMSSDRLGTRARVAFQGTDRSMARSGKQDRRIGAVFGSVCKCGVSQLVKRRSTGGFAEQFGGATVRQSGATGDWAPVEARHCFGR